MKIAGFDAATEPVRRLEQQHTLPLRGKLTSAVEAGDTAADNNDIGASSRQRSSLGGRDKANNRSVVGESCILCIQ